LAYIHSKKFAAGGYVVSPVNTVCEIALPCKIFITTLFMSQLKFYRNSWFFPSVRTVQNWRHTLRHTLAIWYL